MILRGISSVELFETSFNKRDEDCYLWPCRLWTLQFAAVLENEFFKVEENF